MIDYTLIAFRIKSIFFKRNTMKKIVVFCAFCALVFAGSAAQMANLAASYLTQNATTYRTALSKFLDELENENLSQYQIHAPKYLRNYLSKNDDETTRKNKEIWLKNISDSISNNANLSKKQLGKVIKDELKNTDDATLKRAMNGEILLSNELKNSSFSKVADAIEPTIKACLDDDKFVNSYTNLTGARPTLTRLKQNFTDEIFRSLTKGESKISKGVGGLNSVLELIK